MTTKRSKPKPKTRAASPAHQEVVEKWPRPLSAQGRAILRAELERAGRNAEQVRTIENALRPLVAGVGDLRGKDFWNHTWANMRRDLSLQMQKPEFENLAPSDIMALLKVTAKDGRGRARKRHASTPVAPQETDDQRAARRQAVVMPTLQTRGWTRGQLVTESSVGKATVYGYLNGSRKSIKRANRQALADTLEIGLRELPN